MAHPSQPHRARHLALLLWPTRGLGEAFSADDASGVVARRVLLPVLVLPVLLGGLLFLAERKGMLAPSVGMAVLVVALTLVLGAGILLSLREVRWADARRREAERARLELAMRAREAQGLLELKEEALRARDEFLTIASHEMRTPLAALRMQVQLAQRRSGGSDRGAAPHLEAADRVIGRMARLVEDMLEVARINIGGLSVALQLEEVDLVEVAREAVEAHSSTARRAGSELLLAAEGPAAGRWDRRRLTQVISHLLMNALKYGAGHPVKIAIRNDGRQVILTLRDQGPGVRPEERARIFERFERAASIRHYGGFGLGLWMAREVISALGGRISVDDTPGGGATFTVALPRTLAAGGAEQEAARAEVAPTS